MPRKKSTKATRTRTTASKKRSSSARTTAQRTNGAKKRETKGRGRRTAERSPQRTRRGNAAPDLFDLLRTDHRSVTEHFDQIIQILEEEERDESDEARCLELFRTVYQELTAHSKAEEQAVYAALVEEEETAEIVHEARIEHALVEGLLEQLAAGDEVDQMWTARLKVVSELVKHHVKEEEGEMFTRARKAMETSELQELATNFERLKSSMMAELGDGSSIGPYAH
jgi:hemerythrin superfamily protein